MKEIKQKTKEEAETKTDELTTMTHNRKRFCTARKTHCTMY